MVRRFGDQPGYFIIYLFFTVDSMFLCFPSLIFSSIDLFYHPPFFSFLVPNLLLPTSLHLVIRLYILPLALLPCSLPGLPLPPFLLFPLIFSTFLPSPPSFLPPSLLSSVYIFFHFSSSLLSCLIYPLPPFIFLTILPSVASFPPQLTPPPSLAAAFHVC